MKRLGYSRYVAQGGDWGTRASHPRYVGAVARRGVAVLGVGD
jgi:hypothetical protein